MVEVSVTDREWPVVDQIERYIARLTADVQVCRRLTPEVLEDLLVNPRYQISDEDRRRTRSERQDAPEDSDGLIDDDEELPSLFGRSREEKARDPRPSVRRGGETRRPGSTSEPEAGPVGSGQRTGQTPLPVIEPAAPASAARETVVRRWFKRLPSSDAQFVREGTAPTGNLRLAQARHPISHQTWFRNDFFGDQAWGTEATSRGDMEIAFVPFEVVVDGGLPEPHVFRVDHAAYRVADQNNVPTVLKWGDLNPTFRERNYTGWWVILERRADGTFRLELTQTEPPTGSFMG
jgi:hypothetical protein